MPLYVYQNACPTMEILTPNLTIGEAHYLPLIADEQAWIEENLAQADRMAIPQNFELTAPVYDPAAYGPQIKEQSKEYTNPQTAAFCRLLQIPNHFDATEEDREDRRRKGPPEATWGRGGRGGGRGFMRGGRGGRGRGRGSR